MIKYARIKFDKFLAETPKAYLIKIFQKEHWIPKSQCKNFITNKKLGGNVTLPAWLYEKITGIPAEDAPNDDLMIIIEKHVPERREPTKVTVNESLIREPKIKD